MPNGWPGKLKKIRQKERITQSDLVEASGVSVTTISRIERGRSQGSEITKHKIVKALNQISREGKKYKIEDIF